MKKALTNYENGTIIKYKEKQRNRKMNKAKLTTILTATSILAYTAAELISKVADILINVA